MSTLRDLRAQEILQNELETMKKNGKVFTQQPNSNVFFLTTRENALSDCKKTQDDIKKELKLKNKSDPK